MINLQNPNVPTPLQAVEIDAIVMDLQYKFETNLIWLTHGYARAYRHFQFDNGKFNYYPEIYNGVQSGKPVYYQPKPDNDKKGICYFVVGKEKPSNFEPNQFNYLGHEVGIVFWVNLDLINKASLDTELITQQLISEVRSVLTRKLIGTFYRLKVIEICMEFTEIFKEYNLKETENYLKAPYQAFRFNCFVEFQEDCSFPVNRCEVIKQNISTQETLCLLPNLDFNDDVVFNTLTEAQKLVLINKLS